MLMPRICFTKKTSEHIPPNMQILLTKKVVLRERLSGKDIVATIIIVVLTIAYLAQLYMYCKVTRSGRFSNRKPCRRRCRRWRRGPVFKKSWYNFVFLSFLLSKYLMIPWIYRTIHNSRLKLHSYPIKKSGRYESRVVIKTPRTIVCTNHYSFRWAKIKRILNSRTLLSLTRQRTLLLLPSITSRIVNCLNGLAMILEPQLLRRKTLSSIGRWRTRGSNRLTVLAESKNFSRRWELIQRM